MKYYLCLHVLQVLLRLPARISTETLAKSLQIHSIKSIPKLKKSSFTYSNNFISIPRGGGGEDFNYIEPSPNYYYSNPNSKTQFTPQTLGDLDNKNHIQRPPQSHHHNGQSSNSFTYRQKPKPIIQVAQEYFIKLFQTSPTLYYGTLSSILIFIAWQIPIQLLSKLLRNHFINSQYNLRKMRYHTLFTSMLGHTTLTHLAMNLYGFHTFGKSVISTLSMNGIPLSLYCVLAGMFANLFFALVHPSGSCIGLSGVTLSLLALDAKLYPGKDIGFVFHFIPIRLPSYYALIALLIWSTLGTAMTIMGSSGDGVAHATHLGGLMYGIIMYELVKKGIWKNVIRRNWLIMRSKVKRNNKLR